MALIDQEQAAKQIRENSEYVADCQWLKGYNKACEDNAQIIEGMKGQEIIHCKDCVYHGWNIVDAPYGMTEMIHWCDRFYTGENENLEVEPTDFCKWAERKGEESGEN